MPWFHDKNSRIQELNLQINEKYQCHLTNLPSRRTCWKNIGFTSLAFGEKLGWIVSFMIKFIVHHESSKGMGKFEECLTAHCQNLGIVFEVEFHTSFGHSRITFSIKKLNYKKFLNQDKFHLKKSV